MKNFKELQVEKSIAKEMEKICSRICRDVKKDGVEFDEEVVFEDGNRMAIQVCGPGDPSEETCWTQGVVFDSEGNELGCTDCGESFLGEYSVVIGDDEYVVNVVTVKSK